MLDWTASTSPGARSKVCDHFSRPLPPSISCALTRIMVGERRTLPDNMVATPSLVAADLASASRSISDEVRAITRRPGMRASALRTSSASPSEK